MINPPPNPILGLPDRLCRALHVLSLVWIALALGLLELAGTQHWLDHRPGQEAFNITARPIFMVLFGLGAVLAWRWEILGGTLSAFTSAALIVWAVQQLELPYAVAVISLLAIPGLIWVVLDLHDQRPRVALFGIVVVAVAALVGMWTGARVHADIFGASHPSSETAAPADTDLDWIWTGAVTDSSAVVTAKLDDDFRGQLVTAELRSVETQPEGDTPHTVVVDGTVDDHDVVRLRAEGLLADTRYALTFTNLRDLSSEPVVEAHVQTFPTGPASFRIAAGGCARVGSNGKVFDAIAATDPTLFIATGDFHYANIGENDPDGFREILDFTLSQPAQTALYRETPIAYVWDDHDYGDNNADSSSPSRAAAWEVYREYVPHYALTSDEGPIYQAFTVGRVRVILTDVRSARSPSTAIDDADKTMLGDAQKAWLKQELLRADRDYPVTVWVNPVPWVGEAEPGLDDWRGYATERAELADFIAANDIDGLVMLSGDAHMVAIDDGTNTDYATSGDGGFPLLHAAALDRPGHTKGGPYSHGEIGGGGQFGVIDITDHGDGITVTLSGRDWEGSELLHYSFELPTEPDVERRP